MQPFEHFLLHLLSKILQVLLTSFNSVLAKKATQFSYRHAGKKATKAGPPFVGCRVEEMPHFPTQSPHTAHCTALSS
jgi:hypothetical protein